MSNSSVSIKRRRSSLAMRWESPVRLGRPLDIAEPDASSASSIASTAQQMSISFGVAAAGIATALLVPSTHSNPAEMIHGIHRALIALGILTIVSTITFLSLRSGDGDDVSMHKGIHPGG